MIIYNAIRTPDGTVLESKHTHDYKSYLDKNGEEYIVDGGLSYLRRGGKDYTELAITSNDTIELIRDTLTWTSVLDKNGEPLKQPIKVKLKHLTTEHINAILNTQSLSLDLLDVFRRELTYRDVGSTPTLIPLYRRLYD